MSTLNGLDRRRYSWVIVLKQDGSWAGIHIVAGFGSAGKSEYIRHLLTKPGPFFGATPVYESMFRKQQRDELTAGDVFHLDLSNDRRAAQSRYIPQHRFRFLPLGRLRYAPSIGAHGLAATGVLSQNIASVDFLILPEPVLRARITQRTTFSDDIHRTRRTGRYPSARKLRILDACPLADRYAVWMDYFETNGATLRFIHSGNRRYDQIAGRQAALDILSGNDHSHHSCVHEARPS